MWHLFLSRNILRRNGRAGRPDAARRGGGGGGGCGCGLERWGGADPAGGHQRGPERGGGCELLLSGGEPTPLGRPTDSGASARLCSFWLRFTYVIAVLVTKYGSGARAARLTAATPCVAQASPPPPTLLRVDSIAAKLVVSALDVTANLRAMDSTLDLSAAGQKRLPLKRRARRSPACVGALDPPRRASNVRFWLPSPPTC
jgi:hypothetical protein